MQEKSENYNSLNYFRQYPFHAIFVSLEACKQSCRVIEHRQGNGQPMNVSLQGDISGSCHLLVMMFVVLVLYSRRLKQKNTPLVYIYII